MAVRTLLVLVIVAASTGACVRSGTTRQRVVANTAIAVAGAAAITYAAVGGPDTSNCRGTDDPGCSDKFQEQLINLAVFGVGGAIALIGGSIGLGSAVAEHSAESHGAEAQRESLSVACEQWRRSYEEAENAEARDRLLAAKPTHCRRLSVRPTVTATRVRPTRSGWSSPQIPTDDLRGPAPSR